MKTNSFSHFTEVMDNLIKSMRSIENDANAEVEQINELIKRYDVVLDGEDEDLISRYETLYDKLDEYVRNKKKDIADIEEKISYYIEYANDDKFTTILNKKKNNANQIIDCINRIVGRIKTNIISVYNRKIKEVNSLIIQRYEIKQSVYQQPKRVSDIEMDVINNSVDLLKTWSNQRNCNVLFDSNKDGDGGNNALMKKVWKRNNLYFITSDYYNCNIFGGYVSSTINKVDDFIEDPSSFVFSLTRNGIIKRKKYHIKTIKMWENEAFMLSSNREDGLLYQFGVDIRVFKIGNESCCQQLYFNYNSEDDALTKVYPHKFQVKRVIILEMN